MNISPENEHFVRLIVALEPWLEQVVIIGGWAHRLYWLDPRAQQLDYIPIMTLDVDIAVPDQLPVKKPDIRECLLAKGFLEEFMGEDQPPATHYHLGGEETGFYAEFLTPLTGSEYTRGGKRKTTLNIAGAVSQKLRHLELLLNAPWTVTLEESNGFTFLKPTQVQVANPAGFLAHKLLIHTKRSDARFAKDVLYIHDTLETFGGHLAELQSEWANLVRPQLHPKSVRTVEEAAGTLFGEMSDAVRQAAVIARARDLSPEAVLEVCNVGLKQVFG
jgi:nucleotidyltransferase-like protein